MGRSNFNKIVSLCIKVAIVGVAVAYIAYKVRLCRFDLMNWIETENADKQAWLWIPVLLLSIFNWMIEARKWQYLAAYVETISFKHALKSVLAGVTLGIATPNRTGEFGGRVFSLGKEARGEGLVLAAVGSFAQFLVSVLAGVCGFILLGKHNLPGLFNDQLVVWILLVLLITLVLLFLLLLFFETFRVLIFNIPGLRRFRKYVQVLSELTGGGHLRVFGFSLLRYAVYATQFVLLLRLCGIELSAGDAYAMVAITFFAVTVVPTFALTEVAVRGSAAVAFIGTPAGNEVGALAASLLLWVINIMVPALVGIIFVFQLNFFGSKSDAGD